MTSPRDASPTGTSKIPPSQSESAKRVLVVFGTRPEAIKLCPLVRVLRQAPFADKLKTVVCVTGQHREMLRQVLDAFEIAPDYDLDLMQVGQTLTSLSARLMAGLEPVIEEAGPSVAVVQGDTSTTLCAALAAFYAGVPVAHVEAGLRTYDFDAPFPEEMNRVVVSRLARLHFAATQWGADNLLREGISADRIQVTGNSGIDAVLTIRDLLERGKPSGLAIREQPGRRLILITAHRRESFGAGFESICRAIAELAERPDVQVVWPVHPNPNVQRIVHETLRDKGNVLLIDPLDYLPFVDLMRRAYIVITDSGGIQEEGPSLGKPILVLRNKTERPEAVTAGTVKLVGVDADLIVEETARLLDNREAYQRMSRLHNPYGDGHASERIAARLAEFVNA